MTFDGVLNNVYGDAKYTLITTDESKQGAKFDVEVDFLLAFRWHFAEMKKIE